MKYIAIVLFFLAGSFSLLHADEDHSSDEIILQLASGVSIDTINARYNTTTDDVLINGSVYKVKVINSADLNSTVAAMQQDKDIKLVEFNYFGGAPEAVRRTLAVVDGTPSSYLDQSAFDRISISQAHTVSTGTGVVIAVLDTGVDYNHPSLTNHILRDISNQVIGKDFVDNDDDPMDSANGIDDDNDNPPLIDEGYGHGTHVAGIIAHIAPDAKILPVRVLNSDGVGTVDQVAKGIEWAVDYAKDQNLTLVINLSMGLPAKSFLLLDAIQEAWEEKVPVIASAGNDAQSTPHYPAAYDTKKGEVIGVAGTDPNDIKADFSNFGTGWIDLCAPSVGIYSTYPGGEYAKWDGTSMAAPFVTGEAALVESTILANTGDTPGLTSVYHALKNGADYIYDLNPLYKGELGKGRVDLYTAVQIADGSDTLSVKKANFTTDQRLMIEVKSSAGSKAVLMVDGVWKMKFSASKNRFVLNKSMSVAPEFVTVTSSKGGVVQIYIQ